MAQRLVQGSGRAQRPRAFYGIEDAPSARASAPRSWGARMRASGVALPGVLPRRRQVEAEPD